jgi:hypothetical protein
MADNITLKSDVVLTASIREKVKKIADAYNKATNKTITVTSGTRTASSQAEAMHGKLAGGDKLADYTDQTSAKEIKKVYDEGVAAKKPRADVIKAMAAEIEKQIRKGKYISKHLKAGAVDVRSKDMSPDQKKAFKTATTGIAKSVLLETTPPHWHLQFD